MRGTALGGGPPVVAMRLLHHDRGGPGMGKVVDPTKIGLPDRLVISEADLPAYFGEALGSIARTFLSFDSGCRILLASYGEMATSQLVPGGDRVYWDGHSVPENVSSLPRASHSSTISVCVSLADYCLSVRRRSCITPMSHSC